MKKLFFFTVLSLALVSSPALAKEGFYLGAGMVFEDITGSDFNVYDPAAGLNLKLGYNFGPIALEGNWTTSTHTANRIYRSAA